MESFILIPLMLSKVFNNMFRIKVFIIMILKHKFHFDYVLVKNNVSVS